jgi:hypothetical protein
VKKYKRFSEIFYLVILSLTIPFYLALYGASGHEFRPETEDVIWMRIIVAAIVSMTAYLIGRRFRGIGTILIKILFGGTLIATCYGGLNVIWFILNFDFGTDVGFLIVLLSYVVPIVFVYSTINIGYWLVKSTDDATAANKSYKSLPGDE